MQHFFTFFANFLSAYGKVFCPAMVKDMAFAEGGLNRLGLNDYSERGK
jgi:hypothetical protein